MLVYLQLLRTKQWVKNLFVFAPLFFSFRFYFIDILKVFLGFIIYCLASSTVYIFNDLMDIEEDRKHPTKRLRPLACGIISHRKAIFIMSSLAITCIISSFFLNFKFFIIIIAYLIINLLYSLKLKHIPIIDITIIALCFILRVFGGAFIVNIDLSMWIILDTFLLALFIALAKRRHDYLLYQKGIKARKNIHGYNLEMINSAMVIMSCVAIVCYIMYTVSIQTLEKYHSSKLYLTSFFVIVGFLRYLQISFVDENSGSPTEVVLKDRFLQINILGWLVTFYILAKFKL